MEMQRKKAMGEYSEDIKQELITKESLDTVQQSIIEFGNLMEMRDQLSEILK
jgi:hypothetical protein